MATTYRAYSGSERVATAVIQKDGQILQVFPTKKCFEDETSWRNNLSKVDRVDTHIKTAAPKKKKLTTQEKRRNMEMMEFSEECYAWMFKSVHLQMLPEPVIHCTLLDDSVWTLQRSLDFMKAPVVYKNGTEVGHDFDWYPCLTSIRWLLMLAFSRPE